MNWLKNMDLSNIDYMGMDISHDLIEYNKKNNKHLKFKTHNIIESPINKKYDLILCRDLLFHFNIDEVKSSINNFKKSNSTYILTSTFPNSTDNINLTSLGFAKINLQEYPFNFPKPIKLYPEIEDGKYLGLWKLENINIL